jgi:hypothetical protein
MMSTNTQYSLSMLLPGSASLPVHTCDTGQGHVYDKYAPSYGEPIQPERPESVVLIP